MSPLSRDSKSSEAERIQYLDSLYVGLYCVSGRGVYVCEERWQEQGNRPPFLPRWETRKWGLSLLRFYGRPENADNDDTRLFIYKWFSFIFSLCFCPNLNVVSRELLMTALQGHVTWYLYITCPLHQVLMNVCKALWNPLVKGAMLSEKYYYY